MLSARLETRTLCILYLHMYVHVPVHKVQLIVKTDLSNIKWFQSSILLQDKELIPHPASLCPLQQCWAPYMFLLCRRTQKAMRQKGQNAKSHGEQGPCNCWKMHSVSHRETRSSIWKDFPFFLTSRAISWVPSLWLLEEKKRKSTDESQILLICVIHRSPTVPRDTRTFPLTPDYFSTTELLSSYELCICVSLITAEWEGSSCTADVELERNEENGYMFFRLFLLLWGKPK